jgi:hypothetical protein
LKKILSIYLKFGVFQTVRIPSSLLLASGRGSNSGPVEGTNPAHRFALIQENAAQAEEDAIDA